MDEQYLVDTPENVIFAYDLAGIGSRFTAALIDTTLLILIFIVLGIISNLVGFTIGESSALTAFFALLSFAIFWGYYIIFEMVWNGQSPGKRVIKLRVVTSGGRPITFLASAIRNLIRIIDWLPVFYAIGMITMFIDRRSRRLGDLAAGTLVVKERGHVTLDSLVATPMPAAATLTLANIETLDERDYTLVQEFLNRREQLGSEARVRLGRTIASNLQIRLGQPEISNPEQFLQQVAAEYRLLHQE